MIEKAKGLSVIRIVRINEQSIDPLPKPCVPWLNTEQCQSRPFKVLVFVDQKGQRTPLMAGTRFSPARKLNTSNDTDCHPFHLMLEDTPYYNSELYDTQVFILFDAAQGSRLWSRLPSMSSLIVSR